MMWQELQNSERDVYQPAAPTMNTNSSRNAPKTTAARSRNHRRPCHTGGAQRPSSSQYRCRLCFSMTMPLPWSCSQPALTSTLGNTAYCLSKTRRLTR